MPANLPLEYVFYAVWIILAAIGLYLAIQVYRNRISWGQARRMGIPMAAFAWMNLIYGLVLFEGAYGLVSVILDLPFWADIALLLVIFGISIGVYFKLRCREKFNAAAFTALFLIPLGVPGVHTVAKLLPEMGNLTPVMRKFAPVIPGGVPLLNKLGFDDTDIPKPDEVPPNVPGFRKRDEIPRFPQQVPIGDSGYRVEFQDSLSKGTFGDSLTARRLTAKAYTKLRSKVDRVHGLDGVYIRYDNDNLQEVLIVENKVDWGALRSGQMKDEWIDERVDKMILHADAKVRHTGELIRGNRDLVRKELWHHDLRSGVTTISSLDAEAEKTSQRTIKYISNQVRKRCQAAKTKLTCIPVDEPPQGLSADVL